MLDWNPILIQLLIDDLNQTNNSITAQTQSDTTRQYANEYYNSNWFKYTNSCFSGSRFERFHSDFITTSEVDNLFMKRLFLTMIISSHYVKLMYGWLSHQMLHVAKPNMATAFRI